MGESMSEPEFQRIQRQFAAHLRDPSQRPPGNIEPRRLKVYQELFYNNIESFLANGFPVLRSIVDDEPWHALVRRFMTGYRCQSPYFVDIPREFVTFLSTDNTWQETLPAYTLELAHYEYMEVALTAAADEAPTAAVNPGGDLLAASPVVSPLACLLSYAWPVHKISAQWQPPAEEPTWLMVYRDADDRVGFMALNGISARLLQLIEEQPLASGRVVAEQLLAESGLPVDDTHLAFARDTLEDLRRRGIVLGTRIMDTDQLTGEH